MRSSMMIRACGLLLLVASGCVRKDAHVGGDPGGRALRTASTGRIEGFRSLAVDPDAYCDALKAHGLPKPVPTTGTLVATPRPDVVVDDAPQVGGPVPQPSAPNVPPNGDLVIENTTSAFAEVRVGTDVIGQLDPRMIGVLHDVPAGLYRVSLTLPNGFVREVELFTSPRGMVQAGAPANAPMLPGGGTSPLQAE